VSVRQPVRVDVRTVARPYAAVYALMYVPEYVRRDGHPAEPARSGLSELSREYQI